MVEAINYIRSFYGVPYIWGGSNYNGIDCSGLALEFLKATGITIPSYDMTAQSLHDYFLDKSFVNVIGAGALCFYGSSNKGITHITVAVDTKLCIGANGGTSTCTNKETANKLNAFVKLRPIDYRKDLITVLMPKYV